MAAFVKLLGRVFIRGTIRANTGLHIGAGSAGLTIGGLDNPVIRDPQTRLPYIPGSSLKGKMRSLAERARGFDPDNKSEVQAISNIRIHVCRDPDAYATCDVCQLFGVPGNLDHTTPTRLTVRDAFLDRQSLEGAQTDFLYTEVKWEASIDRITSAALPRQVERVPAGACFTGMELIMSLYDLGQGLDAEFTRLKTLILAMQLLEDDYLGGQGSRGSGKVAFQDLRVDARRGSELVPFADVQGTDLVGLVCAQDALAHWARDILA